MIHGLHFYELVLLICGVRLFLGSLWALCSHVRQGKNLAGLSFFFVLPVVMIGFPGIQKIQFEKDKITIENKGSELLKHPGNEEAKATLKEALARASKRAQGRPDLETVEILAQGQRALGRPDRAFELVTSAARKESREEPKAELYRLAENIAVANVESLVPSDLTPVASGPARSELSHVVSELNAFPSLAPETRLAASKALLALGETNQARSNYVIAMEQKANLVVNPRLRETLRAVK